MVRSWFHSQVTRLFLHPRFAIGSNAEALRNSLILDSVVWDEGEIDEFILTIRFAVFSDSSMQEGVVAVEVEDADEIATP
jgi:hypothetical protein